MTSMFIGIKIHPGTCLDHWTPKPDLLQNWPPTYTKLTTFCITHREPEDDLVQRPPVTISGQDSYTPTGMELCTPCRTSQCCHQQHDDDRQRTISGSSYSNEFMLETPCQKTTLNQIQVDFGELKLDLSVALEFNLVEFSSFLPDFLNLGSKFLKDASVNSSLDTYSSFFDICISIFPNLSMILAKLKSKIVEHMVTIIESIPSDNTYLNANLSKLNNASAVVPPGEVISFLKIAG